MQKREALALGFQRAEGKRWGPHVNSGARRLAQATAGQFQLSLWGRKGLSKQEVHHPDSDVSLISAKPFWASSPKHSTTALRYKNEFCIFFTQLPCARGKDREAGRRRRGKEQRIGTPGRKVNLREKQQGRVSYRDKAKRIWDGRVVSPV